LIAEQRAIHVSRRHRLAAVIDARSVRVDELVAMWHTAHARTVQN
jgi:hypothetical protein